MSTEEKILSPEEWYEKNDPNAMTHFANYDWVLGLMKEYAEYYHKKKMKESIKLPHEKPEIKKLYYSEFIESWKRGYNDCRKEVKKLNGIEE